MSSYWQTFEPDCSVKNNGSPIYLVILPVRLYYILMYLSEQGYIGKIITFTLYILKGNQIS